MHGVGQERLFKLRTDFLWNIGVFADQSKKERGARMADTFALQTPRLVLACNAPGSNGELLTKGGGHQIHSQVTPPNVFMLKWTIQEAIRYACETWSANGTARMILSHRHERRAVKRSPAGSSIPQARGSDAKT